MLEEEEEEEEEDDDNNNDEDEDKEDEDKDADEDKDEDEDEEEEEEKHKKEEDEEDEEEEDEEEEEEKGHERATIPKSASHECVGDSVHDCALARRVLDRLERRRHKRERSHAFHGRRPPTLRSAHWAIASSHRFAAVFIARAIAPRPSASDIVPTDLGRSRADRVAPEFI